MIFRTHFTESSAGAASRRGSPNKGDDMRPWMISVILVVQIGLAVDQGLKCMQRIAGEDFPSYYYAVRAAREGRDPYDVSGLTADRAQDMERIGFEAAAQAKQTPVHPYLYPPAFLASISWLGAHDLAHAFQFWYLLSELCSLAAVALLAWHWRDLGAKVPGLLAMVFTLHFAFLLNLTFGQVNAPLLLLTLAGAICVDRKYPLLGGTLIGFAAGLKILPGLFIAIWLWQRRFRPALAGLAALSITLVVGWAYLGTAAQFNYFGEILPEMLQGRYPGLTVALQDCPNHSPANFYDRFFPHPTTRTTVTLPTKVLAGLTNLMILASLAWGCARPGENRWSQAAQLAAVALVSHWLPLYSYEHYLVWVWPGMVLVLAAPELGRLRTWTTGPLLLAVLILAFPLIPIVDLVRPSLSSTALQALSWVDELKFLALIVIFVALLRLTRTVDPAPSAESPATGRDPAV